MKKYIFILLALFLTACSKDLLDKKPIDRISDSAVFNDPALINAYIYELYNELPLHMNNAGWDWNPIGAAVYFPDVLCDEAVQQGTYWDQHTKYNQGLENATTTYDQWWGYVTIRRMNDFLEKVGNSTLSKSDVTVYTAEVRFLRAFAYFEMVKRYGGVPLITKVQQIDEPIDQLDVPRNTEQEVYDFIYSELNQIYSILPDGRTNTDYGRATKYAALSLMSRSMLYAATIAKYGQIQLNGIVGLPSSAANDYFQKAYDASKKIMDYSQSTGNIALYNKYPGDKAKNFYQLFMDKRNVETIFSVQYNGLSGKGHSTDFWLAVQGISVGWGQEVNVLLEEAEAFENIDGSPGKLDRVALTQGSYDVINLFKNKDPRFNGSVLYQDSPWQGKKIERYSGTWVSNGGVDQLITDPNQTVNGKVACSPGGGPYAMTGFTPKKYYDESLVLPQGNQSSTDFIVFRYGEILLNFAEAAFELNKTSDALGAINQLRTRAGIANRTSLTLDNIRNERRVELAFEHHRMWDVRRWRTAVNDLSGSFSGLVYYLEASTGKYRLKFVNKVDGYNRLFLPKHYYHPITPDRIANDPKLVENPGY